MFAFNISVPGFIPYWGAMFVKYSLVTNIVASIVSLLTIILACSVYPIIYCGYYGTNFEEEYQECMKKRSGSYGMLSIFLILHILFFCVSNSISVFSCRALEHSKINVPQVFVLPSAGLVPAPPTVFETISPAPPQAPPPPYTVQEETKGDLRMI
ncbi:uncharacterized protein LOC142160575 isoform X2 [Mixophyes fleayi]|uniref:uncharacterized protein LOC142160575 isoform X2 n=1 Tax=Mixophyes fleayi TaxID=3061075 RepID=UPI003F4DF249